MISLGFGRVSTLRQSRGANAELELKMSLQLWYTVRQPNSHSTGDIS